MIKKLLTIALAITLGAALLVACTGTESLPNLDRGAHHRDGGGFRNPLAPYRDTGFGALVKARFFDEPWASYDPDKHIVELATPELAGDDETVVTWVGHATALIQHRGINVITDPVFSQYASPVQWAGPKRITQPALTPDDMPPIDVVVISHDHYDHLDVRSVKTLGDTPVWVVPLGIGEWLEKRGIAASRIVELDWWETYEADIRGESLVVTATPAQHFSGRSLTDRDRRLWASWAFQWQDFTAWFGGDTGYNDTQFVEIGERIGPIDFAIIPIGAYRPRWFMKVVHVDPAEAVLIHRDIGARASMGVHWGAFVLAAEEVDAPPKELAAAMEASNLLPESFDVFAVGESRRVSPRY